MRGTLRGFFPRRFLSHRALAALQANSDLSSGVIFAAREAFMEHYHKRSNIETAYSMIKGKFGSALRSKSDTGQINEVLCKVLCHNICVLVQATHENQR